MPDRFAVAEATDGLAVHLDVGDDVNLRQALDEPAPGLLDGRPVEIAQAVAERDQFMVGEPLIAHQHHGVIVPGLHDARERRFVKTPEVDAPDFGAERGAGWDHLDRTGGTTFGCGCDTQRHRCLPHVTRERSVRFPLAA